MVRLRRETTRNEIMKVTVTIESPDYKLRGVAEREGDDLNVMDALELCEQALLAVGYCHENVRDAIGDRAAIFGDSTTAAQADKDPASF